MLDEANACFLKTWRDDIVPHCRKEEEVLLPDLARRVPEGAAVITLTLNDHVALLTGYNEAFGRYALSYGFGKGARR